MLQCSDSMTADIWSQRDTGKAGGFQDKIDAALECDAVPVIIGRPLKEEGMSVRRM